MRKIGLLGGQFALGIAMKVMKPFVLLLALVFCLCQVKVWGQVYISAFPYSQNFNTNTTSLPTGWQLYSKNGSLSSAADNLVTSSSFSSTGQSNVYYYATGADGGIGFLTTGTFGSSANPTPQILFTFTNTTGNTVTSLNVSVNYMKYRTGTTHETFFVTGSSGIVPSSLSYTYIADASSGSGSLPGTLVSTNTGTITGLNIANNTTYTLAWNLTGGGANAHALGIDNVVVSLPTTTGAYLPLNGGGTVTSSGSNPTVTINSGSSGISGLKFTQLQNSSSPSVANLGVDSSGKVVSGGVGSFTVHGSDNTYYPVAFPDPGFKNNIATELELGRSNVHENTNWLGSIIAKFRYHTTNWGNGSNFIDADIKGSNNSFVAGWQDATLDNGLNIIVIWLKGGNSGNGITYHYRANLPAVQPVVYDDTTTGASHPPIGSVAYITKTALDDYVSNYGASLTGNIFSNSQDNNYFLGNVNIGTKTSADRLHVSDGSLGLDNGQGNHLKAGSYLTLGNMDYGNCPYISFNALLTKSDEATSTNEFTPFWAGDSNASGLIIRGDAGQAGLHFMQRKYGNVSPLPATNLSNFKDVLTIANDGNVGIGTTNTNDTAYKLFVETGIHTRKIQVDVDAWPDYVFNHRFKMKTLSELESYISLNKHLPDVPDARKVAKEGINLGQNQAVLLKKIEELTLYMIEQNKTMAKQKETMDAQSQAIQEQNKRMEKLETELKLLKK
ncbi:hypothetical protein [Parasediminibacterium sp. JCM 36343]|uniref:hypothetical protein n=1 Tax=Parasediminibacterium sp. JCM 36343 TaxID=3374279 RepID=UPI00397CEA44